MKQGYEEHATAHPHWSEDECDGEDANDEEDAFEHFIPSSSP